MTKETNNRHACSETMATTAITEKSDDSSRVQLYQWERTRHDLVSVQKIATIDVTSRAHVLDLSVTLRKAKSKGGDNMIDAEMQDFLWFRCLVQLFEVH